MVKKEEKWDQFFSETIKDIKKLMMNRESGHKNLESQGSFLKLKNMT